MIEKRTEKLLMEEIRIGRKMHRDCRRLDVSGRMLIAGIYTCCRRGRYNSISGASVAYDKGILRQNIEDGKVYHNIRMASCQLSF